VILNTQPLSHGQGFLSSLFHQGAVNVLIPEVKPSIVFETISGKR